MARRPLVFAAVLTVVLGVAILALPAVEGALWGLAGVLAVGGILLGVRLHQPARPASWVLLAAGVGALAAGDVAFDAGTRLGAGGGGWLLVAELCYLAMFPTLAYALLGLTRTSAALRDRSTVVDLLTLVIAAGLVAWVVADVPAGASPWPIFDRSLAAAHVLGSIVVVVVTVALVVVTGARNSAAVLLAVGGLGLLVADVLDALAQVRGGWPGEGLWELGYLVCYAAWGACALPASMARLTLPVEPRADTGRGLGAVPVLLTALTGPALLMAGGVRDDVADVTVVAVGSAMMTVLVVTRLSDALTAQRRAVARERLLRQACGELVAATDAEGVATTLADGIARLLPRQHAHRVVFVGPAESAGPAWQPLVVLDHQPAAAGGRRSRLTATRLLHPDLRAPLAGLPATLVASLDTDQPGRHRAPVRAVAVGGDHAVLAGLRDALEVLASQAALALRRMGHTVEESRREREAYLSAVGERTADVVILLDADEWIRYASPSMADLLKVTVPVLATWRDIVHRDDHPQVENTLDRARSAPDGTGVTTEWTLRRADGSWIQVAVDCRDLRTHPAVQGLVLTLHDVTPDRRVDLPSTLRRLDRSAPGRNRRSVWRRFG